MVSDFGGQNDVVADLICLLLLQEVDVGPPYASLNESFILGEILRDGTSVIVDAYLVGKPRK